jgi:hypothetical protein
MSIKGVIDIMSWTIVAALIVLVIMHASEFATAIGSLGGFALKEEALYTGQKAA